MHGVTLSVYDRYDALLEQIHIAAPTLERAVFIAVTIGYATESQAFTVHEENRSTPAIFWMCYGPHQKKPRDAQHILEIIKNRLNKGV